MLQISPEKVCFVIAKARAFEERDDMFEDDSGPGASDGGSPGALVASPENTSYEEIKGFIDALNEDEQAELVALAWLGRDDYTSDQWEQALSEAAERHTGATSDYLLGLPLLPDYLESGLDQLGYSCDEP